jgi:hypothetical protein
MRGVHNQANAPLRVEMERKGKPQTLLASMAT